MEPRPRQHETTKVTMSASTKKIPTSIYLEHRPLASIKHSVAFTNGYQEGVHQAFSNGNNGGREDFNTHKAHQLTCLFCCEICARYLALRIGNSYIRALVIMYICKLAVLKGQRKWRRTKTKRTGKPGKGSTKNLSAVIKFIDFVDIYYKDI